MKYGSAAPALTPCACLLPDYQRSPNALNPYGYKQVSRKYHRRCEEVDVTDSASGDISGGTASKE